MPFLSERHPCEKSETQQGRWKKKKNRQIRLEWIRLFIGKEKKWRAQSRIRIMSGIYQIRSEAEVNDIWRSLSPWIESLENMECQRKSQDGFNRPRLAFLRRCRHSMFTIPIAWKLSCKKSGMGSLILPVWYFRVPPILSIFVREIANWKLGNVWKSTPGSPPPSVLFEVITGKNRQMDAVKNP